MGSDGDVAWADFEHRLLRWVLLFGLFALCFLGFGIVANEDAIAKPFSL